jgi:ATP-dependent metalloprotease
LLTLEPANSQDPTSPLLHSDKAFEYYVQALLKANKEASINPAVRRRESLVAAHPLITPSSQEGPSEDSSTPVQEAQEAVSPTSSQTVSRSQQIASSVIAGGSVEPPSLSTPGLGSPGQLSPDMAKLLAALSAGQGGSGNPVHVIIKERES